MRDMRTGMQVLSYTNELNCKDGDSDRGKWQNAEGHAW